MGELVLVSPNNHDKLAKKLAVLKKENTAQDLVKQKRLKQQRLQEKDRQKQKSERENLEEAQRKFAILLVKLTKKYLKISPQQIRKKISKNELSDIAAELIKTTKPRAFIERVLTYGLVIGFGFYIIAIPYLIVDPLGGWQFIFALPPLNPICVLGPTLYLLFGYKAGLGSCWRYRYFYNLLKKKYGVKYLPHQKIKNINATKRVQENNEVETSCFD